MTIDPSARPAPHPPARRSASSSRDISRLRRLVRRRLRSHLARPTSASLTVFAVRSGELAVLKQSSGRPADALLGLRVPSDVDAVVAIAAAVVAERRRHRDDAGLAVAVTRDGTEICFLGSTQGITETWRPRGWLIDACRRTLDLPTCSDTGHPLDLPIALWLDRLMCELLTKPGPLPTTWPDAASLCPVPDRWRSDDPQELGVTLASVTPNWTALRVAAGRGAPLPVPVEPEHALWMDDPMFARWCLGFFPDLGDLRGDVEFLAPETIAAAVEQTIRAAHSTWLP